MIPHPGPRTITITSDELVQLPDGRYAVPITEEDARELGLYPDYDPMIYDVLRETANHLRGRYLHLAREAATPDAARRWNEAFTAVGVEVRAVDSRDRVQVERKTAELADRLRALP